MRVRPRKLLRGRGVLAGRPLARRPAAHRAHGRQRPPPRRPRERRDVPRGARRARRVLRRAGLGQRSCLVPLRDRLGARRRRDRTLRHRDQHVGVRLAGRLGSRVRGRRARALARRARERRRLLAARPPRPGDADARPPPRAPGRRRRRPRQTVGGRPAPGVRLLLSAPGVGGVACRSRDRRGRRADAKPDPGRPRPARAPVAPAVLLVRRRVGPVLPLRAGDRATVAGRRRGARRAGGPAPADVVPRRAVPRLDAGSPWRSRTCGDRPGTASDTSTSTTVRSASTRFAT